MATLALDAGATKLADLLEVDLRVTTKTKQPEARPLTAPCGCLDASGDPDPRVWASLPDRCERCGHWLASAIGELREGVGREGLRALDAAIEYAREGLLEEATLDGVMDEDDYAHWLSTRAAALERDLARLCKAAA